MKQYSIELTRENWQVLQAFLIGYGLKYEPAACYNLVHVTIWCNPMQAENINRFLEANT